MQNFEREYNIYKSIREIDFFLKYRIWKNFTNWRDAVRQKRIAKCKMLLVDELFFLHPQLNESLMRLRKLCYELSLLRLHNIDPMQTLTMESFCETQLLQKQKLQRLLDSFSDKVVNIVKETCDKSLTDFLALSGFNRNESQSDQHGGERAFGRR